MGAALKETVNDMCSLISADIKAIKSDMRRCGSNI
jgi:hypothetical protein